ncbi:MAG TPA: TonB family protein [Longimicrobiaceae bacterium]
MALWMLYLATVASLLGFGAWALERAAARLGWPLRWSWCMALGGSLLLPLLARWTSPGADSGAAAGSIELGPIELTGVFPASTRSWPAELGERLAPLDAPLLAAWIAGAAAVLVFLLISAGRLHRQRRSWSAARVSGRDVLLSTDTGPAVIGLFRPTVVLPGWALELEPSRRELLLAHEEEHVRAADPWLLLAALGLLVLMPWNPPLWWQTRRLRLAIELDCDARVLRRMPRVRAYALLLLELGARRSHLPFAVAAFAEPPSFLERRLLMMTRRPSRRSWAAVLLAGTLALAATFVACDLEQPESVTETLSGSRSGTAVDGAAQSNEPTPSPFTVPPSLINRQEIGSLLADAYPPLLRDAGIGGRVELWIFIDEDGGVQETRLARTSGYEGLDRAAEQVAHGMRFSPAENEGRRVATWIQLPITFQTASRSGESTEAAARRLPESARRIRTGLNPAAAPRDLAVAVPESSDALESAAQSVNPPRQAESVPRFTPRDVEPSLANRSAFARALEESYPAELRAAGRGGSVVLWVHLSEEGKVTEARIHRGSGEPALDNAALSAIRQAEFSPARLKEAPVDVWLQLPVNFRP